jgi:hypothetical protein
MTEEHVQRLDAKAFLDDDGGPGGAAYDGVRIALELISLGRRSNDIDLGGIRQANLSSACWSPSSAISNASASASGLALFAFTAKHSRPSTRCSWRSCCAPTSTNACPENRVELRRR